MSVISNRVSKLENSRGHNDMDRWLKSLSEEELDARIAELDQSLRARLAAEGVDVAGLTSQQICAIVDQFEKNGGHRPTHLEINQEKS